MFKHIKPHLLTLYVFILFFIISVWSPLAGDDWGYAVNGLHENPLVLAFQFYQSWSGRFFSELYGFLVTPHKFIWNLLNPALFTLIYITIQKIIKPRYPWLTALLLLVWMISVKDELRMETYTWLMGTTYVIPLALSLVFWSNTFLLKDMKLSYTWLQRIIFSLILFWIGLTMENVAAVMILWLVIIVLYVKFKEGKWDITWIFFLSISILSFLLLRLSPGASLRLIRDHAQWAQMGLWNQLKTQYPLFIQHTYLDSKVFWLSFTLIFAWVIFQLKFKHRWFGLALLTPAILSSVSLTLSSRFNIDLGFFTDPSSLFNAFYWWIYSVYLFYTLSKLQSEDSRKAIFFLLGAGVSNGVMMLSPIFGFRSSLFTLYYLFVVGLILLNTLTLKNSKTILSVGFTILIIVYSNQLITKYKLVHTTDQIRQEQIAYYKDHPDEKEAWLIRYPIYTIHSGDVEEWDTYHMEVFKSYYGLNQEVHLIFYYP